MKPMQRGKAPVGFSGLKKMNKNTIKRLLSYVTGKNKLIFGVVLLCILISSVAGVIGSLFLQTLIDDYIAPLTLEANPVFTGLLRVILIMAGIYLIGVTATFIQTQLMAVMTQKILKTIRDDMFSHMQTWSSHYVKNSELNDGI